MWAERRDSSDKAAKPLWVQEKLLSVEEELRVTEISAGTVQGSTWGRRRVRAGARAQPHCARGARVSLHRWRRLGWHSRNIPSPHPTSLPCSCSSATPSPALLCSCVSAALTSPLFQWPQVPKTLCSHSIFPLESHFYSQARYISQQTVQCKANEN